MGPAPVGAKRNMAAFLCSFGKVLVGPRTQALRSTTSEYSVLEAQASLLAILGSSQGLTQNNFDQLSFVMAEPDLYYN